MNAVAYPSSSSTAKHETDWAACASFVVFHAVAIGGAVAVGCTVRDLALAAALYVVRMFAVAAVFHRYFAHRAFATSRPFQLVLAVLATTSTQQGPLWWASHHRIHHRHSDTAGDLHSRKTGGFFWAHIGWICSTRSSETSWRQVRDFARFPELRLLNRFHLVPSIALAVVLLAWGGVHALVWGYFVSTCVLWHGTFSLNSVTHWIGTRRFATRDDSRNNAVIALVTLGEGWHNNHHHQPRSARHGLAWWELDPTFWGLRALAAVGLIWNLVPPRDP
ncbi:MAG: Fatty acid desaturase [Labilithrix sp.]|nr:Fatty acid desaturase [Labilithrix sp.]